MIEHDFSIDWKIGLAERSAPLLAETASRFSSSIRVRKDDIEGDGKSVIGLMMLAAETGSRIKVIIEGDDELDAIRAIVKLFAETFSDETWSY